MLGHARHIIGERGRLIARFGRVEAEELGKSRTVLRILMNAELDVLAKGSVEFVELLTILGNLVEELESLLDNVLLDHLHDLVLLQCLTGQVEGQVLRVDNTLDEAQPLRDEVSRIIGNEDATDVELDVVLGLLGLEEIEGGALGNEEDGAELQLTFDRKVLDGKMILPVAETGLMNSRCKKDVTLTWTGICKKHHTPQQRCLEGYESR